MDDRKFDHVGRPTNEELKKYKKKKTLKILLIALAIILLGGGIFLVFNMDSLDFSSAMGNSAAQTNVSSRVSSSPVYSLYTGNLSANALQGATGLNGNIYFVLVDATSNNKNNFKTTAYTYNINNKVLKKQDNINNKFSKYPLLKNNGIVLNTKTNEIYYLNYDGHNNKENTILFGQKGNNYTKNILTNKKVYNIAYTSWYDKYLYVSRDKIYLNTIENNTLVNKQVCYLDDSLKNDGNQKIVVQGIMAMGNNLYVAYQTAVKNSAGKIIKYNNHINLYDIRNCSKKDKKVNLSKKYDLGYDSKKYELEAIFYMNGKIYLGYNGSDFRNIYFYTFDTTNSMTLNSAKLKQNKKVYIQTKVSNNTNGIISYSICKSKVKDECDFKSATKDGRYNIKFGNFSFKREVKEPGTYYVHLIDNFWKLKTSNPIVINNSDFSK